MRQITVTEKYRAVTEGSMAKKEFVRQMRQSYPMFVSQYDGFDSTVQILKNRGMLFEEKKEATTKVQAYDDRPALTYTLDALDRGIRAELAAAGITMPHQGVKPEDYLKAEKKAKDNLEKNPTHYLDLMSGESNKVDKHDKEKEVKRGAADKDTFNDMKKATLKEGYADYEPGTIAPEDLYYSDKHGKLVALDDVDDKYHDSLDLVYKKGDKIEGPMDEVDANPQMSEDAIKAMLGQVVGALRAKYPDITAGVVKDFIRTHYDDLKAGADIEDEFREYISVNYEGPSDMGEKKGTDHDGDGDIDSDDYMAAKDKAIKKAMGKDESYAMKRMQKAHTQDRLAGKKSTYDQAKEKNKDQEKQLKEAIKSIIKKTLLNEAATVKLSDWAESYESFPGVKPVVNELENVVTEIETFYDKMSDKIAGIFEKSSDFENEEGLKIGGFIAPGLESAFRQDLSKVIKKGSFFKKINLPKVRTISQADVDAHNSGERPLGETDVLEEPKSTIFTPNF